MKKQGVNHPGAPSAKCLKIHNNLSVACLVMVGYKESSEETEYETRCDL